MFCDKCGTQNPDGVNFCSRCGSNLKLEISQSSLFTKKLGTFEQLDLISQEIEKLGFIYKLGFYIQGFFILFIFTFYTLFIGPIIVYFWGKRGWPRNSLVKAALYYNVYAIPIIAIIAGSVIFIAVLAAFIFGMGSSR